MLQESEDFLVAYDEMIEYVKNPENHPEMEQELKGRGVGMWVYMKNYDKVIIHL